MNETLIDNWNKVIKDKDIVYHLGDFSLKSNPRDILERLKGKKTLVLGNHDSNIKKYGVEDLLNIQQYISLKIKDISIILFHFPIEYWDKRHYGSIHLHGHSHGNIDSINKSIKRYDVGVDANNHNFYPITFDEVYEKLK